MTAKGASVGERDGDDEGPSLNSVGSSVIGSFVGSSDISVGPEEGTFLAVDGNPVGVFEKMVVGLFVASSEG